MFYDTINIKVFLNTRWLNTPKLIDRKLVEKLRAFFSGDQDQLIMVAICFKVEECVDRFANGGKILVPTCNNGYMAVH